MFLKSSNGIASKKRLQERSAKRTFSTGVGFCQESTTQKFTENEKDVFETSDMWCARMLSLKKYDSLQEAESAFKLECQKPGSKTVVRRNETLLATFHGIEIAAGSEHSLSHGIRQRADLTEEADLQDFKDEVASKTSKAAWRLESDRQAFMEGTLTQATPLLNVQQDIAKARALEAEMEAAWMQSIESAAEQKASEKKAPEAKAVQSVGVEEMGLEAAIARSVQSMHDVLNRQKTLVQQCLEETNALETQVLRDEGKEHQDTLEKLLPSVLEEIESFSASWGEKKAAGVANKNAQAIHETTGQVAKDLKEWLQKGQRMGEYKQAVKTWKSFLTTCKASLRKKDKAATKASTTGSMSSSKLTAGSTFSDLLLCKQIVDLAQQRAEIFRDQGICWNLEKDLLSANAEQPASPVVFSEAQAKPLCVEMTDHDYYKFQKVWVCEQMKKMGGACFLSAQVTRQAVSKKLSATWTKLLGSDEMLNFMRACSENTVKEMFAPQFYQQSKESCQAYLHADFALPDARLVFEGKTLLLGLPFTKIPGNTWQKEGLGCLKRLARSSFSKRLGA